MRMCLRCGGIAYIEYAYQAIVCRSCGETWSIQQYEEEKQGRKTRSPERRLHVQRGKRAIAVP